MDAYAQDEEEDVNEFVRCGWEMSFLWHAGNRSLREVLEQAMRFVGVLEGEEERTVPWFR